MNQVCKESSKKENNTITYFESGVRMTDVGSGGDNVVLFEPEEYQALTEKEESDLETMMTELGFNPNNAEEFVEKLTNELTVLDGVS